jgi:histone-lysine N-methyltransferase SETMAR
LCSSWVSKMLSEEHKISSRHLAGNKWITPPPYSPDLAPSDFHLFLHLKKCLADQRFNNDEDVKRAVQKWLSSPATFYDEGIQKLVSRYDKCLNNGGNCVEK